MGSVRSGLLKSLLLYVLNAFKTTGNDCLLFACAGDLSSLSSVSEDVWRGDSVIAVGANSL